MSIIYKGQRVRLRNEMSDRDFDSAPSFDWLHSNFSSPLYAKIPNEVLLELVAFASDALGPFYIHVGFQNTRNELSAVLLHPKDHENFANRFLNQNWGEYVTAWEKNAQTLALHAQSSFIYETEQMATLLKDVGNLLTARGDNPSLIRGEDIDALALKLWPENPSTPVKKPSTSSAEQPRPGESA